MQPHKRVLLLIGIMAATTLGVEALSLSLLYRVSFREERARLVETAKSQARLIEAVARFDTEHSPDYAGGAAAATLSQVVEAHRRYQGLGTTGEFTLARKEGGSIVFLLSHRHYDHETLLPVPMTSHLAEPMRRALSGQSGTVIGPDYRGQEVLAAYEPVAGLGWGIVAKIDLAEVRAPFLRNGLICGALGLLAVIVGAGLFVRITEPLVRSLRENVAELQQAMARVKQLSGLLPICASCKRIRDDSGRWRQIEAYIGEHSEADFTHGICQDCERRLYPDLADSPATDP